MDDYQKLINVLKNYRLKKLTFSMFEINGSVFRCTKNYNNKWHAYEIAPYYILLKHRAKVFRILRIDVNVLFYLEFYFTEMFSQESKNLVSRWNARLLSTQQPFAKI